MLNNNIKYATAITIGCRLNQTDTALMFGTLQNAGFQIVKPDTDKALSLIIINTCSVTCSAAQKSRQAARSLKKKHPSSYVIVTGCDVETDAKTWDNEIIIDKVIPNSDKTNILKYINDVFDLSFVDTATTKTDAPVDTFNENATGYYPFKSRANIKIQDGCDSYCTYCIVPYGRGKSKSRNWDNTLEEFGQLVKNGHKEVVLTGVNIATYDDDGRNLIDLLKEMVKIKGDFRIRLSSTEPQFNMHGLIDTIASNNKICRFLHLPLQYGENSILDRMGRHYKKEEFAEFVLSAVEKIPDICIGSDIIVGFPGETDDIFERCTQFISSLPLAYLHVFKYSKRQGTPAASYKDQVSSKDSTLRHQILTATGNKLAEDFINKQIGKTANVLFENYINEKELVGWTDNYIKITALPPNSDIDKKTIDTKFVNNIIPVKITGFIDSRHAGGEILV
ncbi:MAG: tRNA (N(6)-L-threonylcarbamoyladenosine(37)-C(2))-methylthiotransferase MtaB [bacterium]|nr:tRNA (N(6)-L-threonylcarbamoyladenosine(37)-C(2))-methylthiotransferase MtaB [bacterium]